MILVMKSLLHLISTESSVFFQKNFITSEVYQSKWIMPFQIKFFKNFQIKMKTICIEFQNQSNILHFSIFKQNWWMI